MITGKTAFTVCLAFVLLLMTAGISAADFQGTIGTRFAIIGSDFGIQKPRVYIEYEQRPGVFRKVYGRVESWSDTYIQCRWTKAVEPGTYNLWVRPRGKGSAPIPQGTFTIMAPVIDEVTPDTLTSGTTITINGQFFTDKKAKVYLRDLVSLKMKGVRVIASAMEPETGESSLDFVVPQWGSGNYEIFVQTLVGDVLYASPTTNPIDFWHPRKPPQGRTLNGVTYGKGMFVAVGQRGAIITSNNGLEWHVSPSGVSKDLFAVAFGNGRFTAVGDKGIILTSSDGVDWSPGISGTDNDLYDVTFGAGVFVAAGGDKIFTSPDGLYWTTIALADSSFSVSRITYGNGIFIAVGTYTFFSSTNGADWSGSNIQQNPLDPFSSSSYAGVLYTNGILYLVNLHEGIYGSGSGVTSSIDGVDWEPTNAECADAVAYGNGTFIIVNDGCPFRYRSDFYHPPHSDILTSSDGKAWSVIANPLKDGVFLKDVTYGDGIFVAVGNNGVIFTSPQ